jgi:predicted transcriptional regulator
MKMIGVRLDEAVTKVLKKIAAKEHRPLSNLIRLALMDWLKYRHEIEFEIDENGKVKGVKK